MKKTLPFLLFLTLLPGPVSCTKINGAKLWLERNDSPDGIWTQVPSNLLPIMEDGAFLDLWESDTGYYRMRIEPAEEWGVPLSMPLEDVPQVGRQSAQELLDSLRDLEDDPSWAAAVLGPVAFPMYAPGTNEPAYMEFAVLEPSPKLFNPPFEATVANSPRSLSASRPRSSTLDLSCSEYVPRGRIIVSLTEDDLPVAEYSTEGGTHTECLRKMAKCSAVRIVKFIGGFKAAENQNGDLVAYIGSPPVWYPDDILDLCGKVFEGSVTPDGDKHPEPPLIEGKPYEKYDTFKMDYQESKRFQEARRCRKEAAAMLWDIHLDRLQNAIAVPVGSERNFFEDREVLSAVLDDPKLADVSLKALGILVTGRQEGRTALHVQFSGGPTEHYTLIVVKQEEEPLSSEPLQTGWTGWDTYYPDDTWAAESWYTQEPGEGCVSGCGATAWAMLYGWFDRSGRCPDLFMGAPYRNTRWVKECIWYIVPKIETYCVGEEGATNPWNMYKGYKWAEHKGYSYDCSDSWTAPCLGWLFRDPQRRLGESIRYDKRPAIAGFWCTSPHYALAYVFKLRRWKLFGVTLYYQGCYKMNLGWGGPTEWVWGDEVFFGMRANFY